MYDLVYVHTTVTKSETPLVEIWMVSKFEEEDFPDELAPAQQEGSSNPRKTLRTDNDSPFLCPADPSEEDRPSPDVRKGSDVGRAISGVVARRSLGLLNSTPRIQPLSFATTAEDLVVGDHDSDDDIDIDALVDRPLELSNSHISDHLLVTGTSPTPAPRLNLTRPPQPFGPQPQQPTPPPPQQNPVVVHMVAAPGVPPIPMQPPPVVVGALQPPPLNAGGLQFAPLWVCPSAAAALAMIPPGHASNPHLGYQPSRPAPANNIINEAPYQTSVGDFRNYVFTKEHLHRGSSDANRLAVETAGNALALVMFNGGQKLATTYINCPDDISLSLSHLGSADEILVSRPVPIADAALYATVRALGIIVVKSDLAYHIVDPYADEKSWSCGNWSVVSHRPLSVLLPAFRAGMVEAIQNDAAAFRIIDQATQSPGNALSASERVFNVANTFDIEYFEHESEPIIAGYLKPFTNNTELDGALRTIIRKIAPTSASSPSSPKPGRALPQNVSYVSSITIWPTSAPSPAPTPPGGAPLTNSRASKSASSARPTVAVEAAAAEAEAGPVVPPMAEWQSEGEIGPGSAGQQSWYVDRLVACPLRRDTTRLSAPPRGAKTANGNGNTGTGGDGGFATGHQIPEERPRVGGELADGRSEANRDGHRPLWGGSPRRADDERNSATLDPIRGPGGVNTNANVQYARGSEQQSQTEINGENAIRVPEGLRAPPPSPNTGNGTGINPAPARIPAQAPARAPIPALPPVAQIPAAHASRLITQAAPGVIPGPPPPPPPPPPPLQAPRPHLVDHPYERDYPGPEQQRTGRGGKKNTKASIKIAALNMKGHGNVNICPIGPNQPYAPIGAVRPVTSLSMNCQLSIDRPVDQIRVTRLSPNNDNKNIWWPEYRTDRTSLFDIHRQAGFEPLSGSHSFCSSATLSSSPKPEGCRHERESASAVLRVIHNSVHPPSRTSFSPTVQ
ncbi:hypothetical protein B0H11DRAFT_1936725 [Mycena galericulata]|nr:hypothetical protein B0H11DRAFT_1936725 [Mycena galericulata]